MLIHIQDDILRLQGLGVLELLLADRTTGRNILWATDAYAELGRRYARNEEITVAKITGDCAGIIRTRARKAFEQQSQRTKARAEVFTPLWVVSQMTDYLDEVWFQRKAGFHKQNADGHISFNSNKTWQQYVENRRLEITCGEAPFLTTRYDAVSGEVLALEKRVGLLDRKLRAVSENTETIPDWLHWAVKALRASYAYEFQGDSLLIARINVIMSVWESFEVRWGQIPTASQLRKAVEVVSWNIWQMDGLTDRVPYAKENLQLSLFDLLPEAKPPLPPYCRIKNWRQQRTNQFRSLKGERTRMKFDYIIGNPPYQEERQGDSNTATPIYHNFVDSVYCIGEKALLITPARFLFNAGYTPKEWNNKMLNDEHLKVVMYSSDSSSVFQGVEIKGGIAITYRDPEKNYGAIRVFTQYPEVNSILHRVIESKGFIGLNEIIVTSFAYHYTKTLYEENPYLRGRASKGHDYDIQSNAFSVFQEVFLDEPAEREEYIRMLGRDGRGRCRKYIKRKYVTYVSNLDAYKVFFAKATGTGQFGEALPEAILGAPGDGGTVTYISIGRFETTKEADNCIKYTKTRFARALLSVLKVTQDNTPAKWAYVPLQDFTPNSDIDWSQSVADIDRQLYAKYGLDEKEIEFIETHVKEMA